MKGKPLPRPGYPVEWERYRARLLEPAPGPVDVIAMEAEKESRDVLARWHGHRGGFKSGRPSMAPPKVHLRALFADYQAKYGAEGLSARQARAALVGHLAKHYGLEKQTVRGWLRGAGITGRNEKK